MQLSRFLFSLCWLLLPVALSGTTWLYLYPLFQSCAFPQPTDTSLPLLSSRAPFRLLALGDPQLEGDSSLPDPDAPVFPSLANVTTDLRNAHFEPSEVRDVLAAAAKGALRDSAAWLEGYRKMVDLWGNDWYLAHIVRSLRWWTEPSHISVLGDLLGSQWITDGEFEKRAGRYWGTVMRGLERVPDGVMGVESESDHYDEPGYQRSWGGRTEVLGEDEAWATRVINIAGNHDIGYAGDIDVSRVERFERAFGSVNWDIWFTLPNTSTSLSSNTSSPSGDAAASSPSPPALRLVILNTMNLDTPAYTESLQQQTYAFMNHVVSSSRPVTDKTHATILLTHIPLHKAPGVCVDSPFFDFFEGGHGVREQNMLSEYGSKIVLESIFGLSGDARAEGQGLGRRGLVVNGHDHEGCDVLHWIRQDGVETCDDAVLEQRQEDWAAVAAALDAEALESSALNETRETADDVATLDNSEDAEFPNADKEKEEEEEEEADAGPQWRATRFPPAAAHHFSNSSSSNNNNQCTHIPSSPHLREITLRSMMGEFGGHAGFLSAWFDPAKGEEGEWVLEFASCAVGVQHWWWGVHIVDLIAVVAFLGAWVARAVERVKEGGETGEQRRGKEKEKVGGKRQDRGEAMDKIVVEKEKVVELRVEPGAKSLAQAKKV